MRDDGLPCRGSDCCILGDLAIALLVVALFAAVVILHALLPPPHP